LPFWPSAVTSNLRFVETFETSYIFTQGVGSNSGFNIAPHKLGYAIPRHSLRLGQKIIRPTAWRKISANGINNIFNIP